MPPQALVIPFDISHRHELAVGRAQHHLVVAQRFRLWRADLALLVRDGRSQRQFAVETRIEHQLHHAQLLRLIPTQLEPCAVFRKRRNPAIVELAGHIARLAREDILGLRTFLSVRCLGLGAARQVEFILVFAVLDRLIVTQERLLQFVQLWLVVV
jgi:hypothetical protein